MHIALAMLLAASGPATAAQLPVRTYTTLDGLPRNTITCLYPDRRGFIWLCTIEGLARFDGYQFRTYGVDQGLPSPVVNSFLETRGGLLVAGTGAGMAVLKPRPKEGSHSRFDVYYPGPGSGDREIQVLMEDRAGVLWCGTSAGLFRVRWSGASPQFEAVLHNAPIVDLAQDQAGNLWAAALDAGLLEITPAREIRRYGEQQGLPHLTLLYAVAVDGEGTVWAGTHAGLCKLRRNPMGSRFVERVFTSEMTRNLVAVNCLYASRSGRVWAGLRSGASEWTGDPARPFRHWGAGEGLTDNGVHAIAEDGAGNLWIGTWDQGAKRIAHGGFVTYTRGDGLARNTLSAFAEERVGDLLAVTLADSLDLNRFDGDHFTAIHPRLPGNIRWFGWGTGRVVLEDRGGDWWVATGEGLCRFDGRGGAAGLARSPPKAVYTTRNGLAADEIFRLFEDRRGDIWVATNGPASVSRWDRASSSFGKSLIPGKGRMFTAFAEDRAGNIWIGSSIGLFRWRGGRVERMDVPGTIPDSAAALYLDRSGRLWLGGRQGLFRCDDPLTEHPKFRKVLGQAVPCIAQDRWGRIYACTGRGVVCLDPASSRQRLFTTADGLGPGLLQCVYEDRRGDLWFGLTMSASRFTPQPDTEQAAAPVYITSVRTSGHDVPVAAWGETSIGRVSLRPYENSVEVDFVGIEMGTGRSLEYEYRLDGAQRDWQPLGRERSVHLAGLASGGYRLLVRAINNEGAATDPPASVEIFVATPLWRRWWSLSLMTVVLAAGLYGVHRSRMSHLIELERIRTRIATDLHDDVGASLSQVAIMSEVVSRGAAEPDVLGEIAATSRELLQSMNEIVWAIDPSHDRLRDLSQRMRWFAGETLSGCGVVLQFEAGQERELRLSADTRRQVFLIFKECVNNIARHAHAGHAKIALTVEQNHLILRVEDDGCGFDAGGAGHGHGLQYMARRAGMMNAAFEVHSRPGEGVRVTLRVPLAERRRRNAIPA